MAAERRSLDVHLATPRGFCAGVERAIDIVCLALERFGPPIYVRHEIVHNRHVVDALRRQGAVFVEELDSVPDGARTIFSAHGVARSVEREADRKNLQVIDATCPLVAKVHRGGQRYAANGHAIILIGHEGHPEVTGTIGQIDGPVHIVGSTEDAEDLVVETPDRVAYITQTTLSVRDTRDIIDVLKRRFPGISGPDTRDICYATQNRQTAVMNLADRVDTLFVVGASNSSNSNRLREIGEAAGLSSFLVDSALSIRPDWLQTTRHLGLTAGASAPESLVQDVLGWVSERFDVTVHAVAGPVENTTFRLPSIFIGADDPQRSDALTAQDG